MLSFIRSDESAVGWSSWQFFWLRAAEGVRTERTGLSPGPAVSANQEGSTGQRRSGSSSIGDEKEDALLESQSAGGST